jgi:hypothetical protein
MERELRSLTVFVRYGISLVGLAVALYGIVAGGVAAAQYYLGADIKTGLDISNSALAKDAAIHGMAVGLAALLVGTIVGLIGLIAARRAIRILEQEQMWRAHAEPRPPAPEAPAPEQTIDLTDAATIAPIPATVGPELAPFAMRVWQCKLGVDLQNQRLRAEGLGAESRIDADLYVLELRNLVQAVKAAQAQTRSMLIWQAITTFGRTAGDPDEFLARLERAATDPEELRVEFHPGGTVIHMPPFAIPVDLMTRAAHQLATTTFGDLSGIRGRTAQASRAAHVPTS